MATPLELLRQGLKEKRWDKISRGYELLSGELIEVHEPDAAQAGVILEELLYELEGSMNKAAQRLFNPTPQEEPTPEPEPSPPKTKKRAPKKPATKKKPAAPVKKKDDPTDPWAKFRTSPPNKVSASVALAKENTWESDEGDDANIKLNELMCGSLSPSLRNRPKVRHIKRTCERCNKEYKLHSDFKARKFEKDDDPTAYVCDKCLPKPEYQREWE